jgi:hypothetical protein
MLRTEMCNLGDEEFQELKIEELPPILVNVLVCRCVGVLLNRLTT